MLENHIRFAGAPGPGNNDQTVIPIDFIKKVPFKIQRYIGSDSIVNIKELVQHRSPPLPGVLDKTEIKMSSVLDKNALEMTIVLDKIPKQRAQRRVAPATQKGMGIYFVTWELFPGIKTRN
jgi:hypothetical protein